MRLKITNSGSNDRMIVGLPGGGVIRAGESETFQISPGQLSRYHEGVGSPLAQLARFYDAGEITFEKLPDVDSVGNVLPDLGGQVYQKKWTINYGDFTADAAEESILSSAAFPTEAWLIGDSVDVQRVVAFAEPESDAIVFDVGTDDSSDETRWQENTDATTTGHISTDTSNGKSRYVGGKKIKVRMTCTDNDGDLAKVKNFTAGQLVIRVLYVMFDAESS